MTDKPTVSTFYLTALSKQMGLSQLKCFPSLGLFLNAIVTVNSVTLQIWRACVV